MDGQQCLPQVSLAERKSNLTTGTRLQLDLLKAPQSFGRFSGVLWEANVQLRLLGTRKRSRILHRKGCGVSTVRGSGDREIGIGKGGVGKTEPEFKSGGDVVGIHVSVVEKEFLCKVDLGSHSV